MADISTNGLTGNFSGLKQQYSTITVSDTDILTPEQASELLQCHWRTVVRYAERGIVPGRKIGRMWRFSRRRLLRYIEAEQ